MKICGIEFPKPLLAALRNGKMVVFAGAGVSIGEPASLPGFNDLTTAIATDTGATPLDGEQDDRFLGRLKHKGVDVHKRAADHLSTSDSEPAALHFDLLKLYSTPQAVRIVTTNFDTLFEQASEEVFDSQPEIFKAPALPLGSEFNGIVHVHGSTERPNDMVLTDSDFGRAYLTEGWARRFLLDLFRSYTVLFVGYSHNDTVMNYLARALPVSETGRRFALTEESRVRNWQLLEIEPIVYPKPSDGDHSALYRGIACLSEYARRGILDWQHVITAFAKGRPPVDEESSDLIADALSDPTLTRFFTDAASDPEWIDWLDGRKRLDSLFSSSHGDLSEQDAQLARWLAQGFARSQANRLFHTIASHDLRIHPILWVELGRDIGARPE